MIERIAPGTTMSGVINGKSCDASGYCGSWNIDTYAGNSFKRLVGYGTTNMPYNIADKAVLEAYGIDHCVWYPNARSLRFYGTSAYEPTAGNPNGTNDVTAQLGWGGWIWNVSPVCDRNVITNFLNRPTESLLLWNNVGP
jgi:hypothetical protein